MAWIELRDRRVLVGHTIVRARDRQRVRRESAVDERILLVLHDDETAALGVVEQASIVGDQRGLGFVRPAADHDRVVVRQIAAGERVRADQLDGHADGQQRFGHAVGGAAHVADMRQGGKRNPRGADLRHRRLRQRARPDVRVIDDLERSAARAQLVAPRLETLRDGRRETHDDRLCFVLACEREALGGDGGPSRGHRDGGAHRGSPARAIRHGDGEVPGLARATIDRPEQLLRRNRDVHVTRHEDGTADLADRLIAIAVHHFPCDRHRLAADEQPDARGDGRRLERQPPHIRRRGRPIVEATAIGQRPLEEIGLRPFGIACDG